MSSRERRPRSADRQSDDAENTKTYAAFWRAFRYLAPYRGMITVSILCALFVGVAFAGGLGTMLPIMRVLLEGDTLKSWTDREIAEKRLDAKLLSQPVREVGGVQIVSKIPRHLGDTGLQKGDTIRAAGPDASVGVTLDRLADPAVASLPVTT